jgi:hypothetical protein
MWINQPIIRSIYYAVLEARLVTLPLFVEKTLSRNIEGLFLFKNYKRLMLKAYLFYSYLLKRALSRSIRKQRRLEKVNRWKVEMDLTPQLNKDSFFWSYNQQHRPEPRKPRNDVSFAGEALSICQTFSCK